MINLAKLSFLVDIVQSDEKSLLDKKKKIGTIVLALKGETVQ